MGEAGGERREGRGGALPRAPSGGMIPPEPPRFAARPDGRPAPASPHLRRGKYEACCARSSPTRQAPRFSKEDNAPRSPAGASAQRGDVGTHFPFHLEKKNAVFHSGMMKDAGQINSIRKKWGSFAGGTEPAPWCYRKAFGGIPLIFAWRESPTIRSYSGFSDVSKTSDGNAGWVRGPSSGAHLRGEGPTQQACLC